MKEIVSFLCNFVPMKEKKKVFNVLITSLAVILKLELLVPSCTEEALLTLPEKFHEQKSKI